MQKIRSNDGPSHQVPSVTAYMISEGSYYNIQRRAASNNRSDWCSDTTGIIQYSNIILLFFILIIRIIIFHIKSVISFYISPFLKLLFLFIEKLCSCFSYNCNQHFTCILNVISTQMQAAVAIISVSRSIVLSYF